VAADVLGKGLKIKQGEMMPKIAEPIGKPVTEPAKKPMTIRAAIVAGWLAGVVTVREITEEPDSGKVLSITVPVYVYEDTPPKPKDSTETKPEIQEYEPIFIYTDAMRSGFG
jgi:hypothetical protein